MRWSAPPTRLTLLLSSVGLLVTACTNDYGHLDFSGGLEGVGRDAGGDGGTAGSGGDGGSGGSGGAAGGGGTSGSGGTIPDASIDGSASGGAPDAAIDSAAPDTGAGGAVEGGPPDAGMPEASVDAPPLGCAARYGTATGFILCTEEPTQCTFQVTTAGSNCGATCTAFGGTCIDGNDNTGPCVFMSNNPDDCTTNRNDTICICTRP